jgi:hypothetical protein
MVCASAIRTFLADALGADYDVRCRYTVSSIGITNDDTGALTVCDTACLYDLTGADVGENIALGDTVFAITRYGVICNDLT